MATQAFDPKFMKVGVLTAALRTDPARGPRFPDPDSAIEEGWSCAERGPTYISCRRADRPRPCRRSDARSRRQHLDLGQAVRQDRAERVKRMLAGQQGRLSDVGYFDKMLNHIPRAPEEHEFAAHLTRGMLGVDACAACRPQRAAQMERNSRLRAVVHTVLRREGRAHSGEQWPEARLDDRDIGQQIATHLRLIALHRLQKHGGRLSSGSLRPIPRDPDESDTRCSSVLRMRDTTYSIGASTSRSVATPGGRVGIGRPDMERGDENGKPPQSGGSGHAWKKRWARQHGAGTRVTTRWRIAIARGLARHSWRRAAVKRVATRTVGRKRYRGGSGKPAQRSCRDRSPSQTIVRRRRALLRPQHECLTAEDSIQASAARDR